MLKTIWQWLQGTPGSWIGHAAQGFAVALVSDLVFGSMNPAVLAVVYHFGVREAAGVIDAATSGDDYSLMDGAFDFLSPFAGMFLYEIVTMIL